MYNIETMNYQKLCKPIKQKFLTENVGGKLFVVHFIICLFKTWCIMVYWHLSIYTADNNSVKKKFALH